MATWGNNNIGLEAAGRAGRQEGRESVRRTLRRDLGEAVGATSTGCCGNLCAANLCAVGKWETVVEEIPPCVALHLAFPVKGTDTTRLTGKEGGITRAQRGGPQQALRERAAGELCEGSITRASTMGVAPGPPRMRTSTSRTGRIESEVAENGGRKAGVKSHQCAGQGGRGGRAADVPRSSVGAG